MRSLRKIIADDRGANAIEYAIIAALIGVGLIGSLTATRGSLSAIFGVASSKMANSDAGTAAPAQPNPLFAGKTLTNRTSSVRVWGATQYDYTYSDGSSATYYTAAAYRGSYYRSNVTMRDAPGGMNYIYTPSEVDTNTGQTLAAGLSTVAFYPSGNQKTYTNYSYDASGQIMTGTVTNYPDQSGGAGTSGGTVTAQASQFQTVYDQYNAYKANP